MAKKKKKATDSYAPAAVAAAVTGVAYKGGKDLEAISHKMRVWDDSLSTPRNIAANRKLTLQEASQAIDTYTKGGRDVARSRFLGVRVGEPIVGIYRSIGKVVPKVTGRGTLSPQEMEKLDEAKRHYKLFTRKGVSPGELRSHMVEKGLSMSTTTGS